MRDSGSDPSDWRGPARIIIAILGIILAAGIGIWTLIDREPGETALAGATINIGLYTERMFMLAVILTVMIAVYIGTRADE